MLPDFPMALIKPHSPVLLPIIASLLCLLGVSWGATEAEILIKFKNSLSNVTFLADWDESVSPCNDDTTNWTGLRCQKGSVFGLRLENMGLKGVIDIDTLMGLPNLRTLSFMANNFNGSMPSIKKISSRGCFTGMKALQKVYLARNQFTA